MTVAVWLCQEYSQSFSLPDMVLLVGAGSVDIALEHLRAHTFFCIRNSPT